MRKIQLNLESMSVESFETDAVSAERGTVDAHQQRTFNGCGSEVDRCPSSRGCTFIGDCVTQLC
jgi:hypothetical protein